MLGFEEWPGNCQLSCGACAPPAHVRNRFLSESTSAKLLAAAESVGELFLSLLSCHTWLHCLRCR